MPEPSPNADDLKHSRSRPSSRAKKTWRWIPFSIRRKSRGWQVQIFWKQMAVFTMAAGLLGWLGAASAAYLFIKYHRGFTDVRFAHMLFLPLKWHEYEVARGEFLIKNARQDLEAQKYREAFYGFRLGLIKSPANTEARLLLAQYYFTQRPDLTRLTLLEGFAHHKNDQAYLKILFSFLLQQQDDRQVLAYYKELLADDPALTPRNQLVALAAATSCYYRGDYDGMQTILRRYQLETTRDGRLLVIRMTWDRGLREPAVASLQALGAELPDDEEIYGQTITYLRELGRHAEAGRVSFVRALANPRNARARIDQLHAAQKEGDAATVQTGTEDALRDFAADSPALIALADFAATTGDPALARRIYEDMQARGLNWEAAALMTVEAHITAKNYPAALELAAKLLKDSAWTQRHGPICNGLQAIASYGLGDADAAQLFLTNFLNEKNLRAEDLVAVSQRLIALGARTQARSLLTQAVRTDALSQAALTRLVQLDIELNNTTSLGDNLRKLLTLRRPSQAVLRAAYDKLGSDLFLFSPDRATLLGDLRTALADSPGSS